MNPVIKVEKLSKYYTISHQKNAGYGTLKDDLANVFKRRIEHRGGTGQTQEKFWALRDVSFEVNQGEIFGIVGRNGSGKSTLLKILSRIVEPNGGRAELHGRVASLLEVGTGFHTELTGRENVYLNGSLLGMSRQEINSKFKEIVEFSEVEKFLDTPVKFYSSGMYVRLAFSIAAHLESEILILDEVLSVGDAGFQQKSMKKILSTIQSGRTVIFVSHSMGSVRQICTRGLLLKNGRVETIGPIGKVIDSYMAKNLDKALDNLDETTSVVTKFKPGMYASSNPKMNFKRIELLNTHDREPKVHFNEPLEVKMDIEIKQPISGCRVGITMQTYDGVMVGISHNDDEGEQLPDLKKGVHSFTVRLSNPLRPGKYLLGFSAYEDEKSKKRASMYVPGGLVVEVLEKTKSGILAPEQDISYITFDSKWSKG